MPRKHWLYARCGALAQLLILYRQMRIAIPDWEGRVSPVFDVAATLVVADIGDGRLGNRQTVQLVNGDMHARARQLADLEVNVLVCGAISLPLETVLDSAGIEVFSQTCGEVDVVLAAFVAGSVPEDAFLMPGSCGRRRFRRRRRGPRGQGARDRKV